MKRILKSALILFGLGLLVSCGNPAGSESYTMKATVVSISPNRLEVEVYSSEIAEGPYSIIVDESTKITDSLGKKISLSDIAVGDKIEITYGGQVMLSYPPQVYAIKIKKL